MKKLVALLFFSLLFTPTIFSQNTQEPPKTVIETTSDKTESKSDLLKKAKEIMMAARKAKSEKDITEIKDIKTVSLVTLSLPQDKFEVSNETTIKFPSKVLTVINGPFGEIKNSYDGNSAWAMTPGGVQEFFGENATEFENALAGDPISVLRNFDQENYKVEFLEESSFQEQPVNIVMLRTNTGHEIKLYIDLKNNMIIGKSFQSKAAGTTFSNEEIYSNFQKFDTVQIPMKRILKRNNELFAEVEVKEVKINSKVDDKVFLKPE